MSSNEQNNELKIKPKESLKTMMNSSSKKVKITIPKLNLSSYSSSRNYKIPETKDHRIHKTCRESKKDWSQLCGSLRVNDELNFGMKEKKNWSDLCGSLRVNDELSFKLKGKKEKEFKNFFIKDKPKKSFLDQYKAGRKKKKKRINCRTYGGERFTLPEFKKFIKKVKPERESLHGFSNKNFLSKKFSVYEHREKFHGLDQFDEFQ